MKALLLVLFSCLFYFSNASTIPSKSVFNSQPVFPEFKSVQPGKMKTVSTHKLNIIQRIAFAIFQKKLKRSIHKLSGLDQEDKEGLQSLFMGLGAITIFIIGLSIPLFLLLLFSIPLAIMAIVYGSGSMKSKFNLKGLIGIITGALTLSGIMILLLLVLIAFSAFRFG
ncbi:MAG: hypothetical protein ACJ748_03605 [Flavisolibacter sp.]